MTLGLRRYDGGTWTLWVSPFQEAFLHDELVVSYSGRLQMLQPEPETQILQYQIVDFDLIPEIIRNQQPLA